MLFCYFIIIIYLAVRFTSFIFWKRGSNHHLNETDYSVHSPLMFIELISDFFQKCVNVKQHQKNVKREINAEMIHFWIDI